MVAKKSKCIARDLHVTLADVFMVMNRMVGRSEIMDRFVSE